MSGAVCNGVSFGHPWGRNGELCVAVAPVTVTAGIYRLIVYQPNRSNLTVVGPKILARIRVNLLLLGRDRDISPEHIETNTSNCFGGSCTF